MRALPWIIAGAGVGLAAYFVLNQPGPQFATGNDDVEDAAIKTANWGSKQRIKGTGGGLVGKLKEGVGRATGHELAGEGALDKSCWRCSRRSCSCCSGHDSRAQSLRLGLERSRSWRAVLSRSAVPSV